MAIVIGGPGKGAGSGGLGGFGGVGAGSGTGDGSGGNGGSGMGFGPGTDRSGKFIVLVLSYSSAEKGSRKLDQRTGKTGGSLTLFCA